MKINKLTYVALLATVLFMPSCGGEKHQEDDEHEHGEASADAHNEANNKEDGEHAEEIVFTPAQAKAAGMQLETMKPSPFSEVIKTSGRILSAQGDESTVAATSNGIVSFASGVQADGCAVRQGGVIFTISAKNLVDGDPVTKARIEWETARNAYERAEALVKDNIISAKDFEQVRSQYETAKASYNGVAQRAGNGGVAVTSPLNGFIKSRLVKQGEYVTVGQPVAVVSQNRRLVLRADVSQKYWNHLSMVGDANFRLAGDAQHTYSVSQLNGRLLSFGKSSDDAYYIPVSFEFDNVGSVVPGAFAEVYLLGKARGEVLSVPVTALTEEQGVFFVYVQMDEEGYRKQEVTLGANNGERVEILSGLKAGDKVVTKGALQVKLASLSGAIPEGHNHNH